MNKLKKYLIIIILFFVTNLYGEFQPWNSDIKVGDELNKKQAQSRSNSVLNGAQGGAYFMIRFFQIVISPQNGPKCRHTPTCSAYGRIAVEKHGALLGSFLAGDRLLRCNPFYPPEKDPVPDEVFSK
ncbi:MAG: membrane protein insertion efficiency factor YidD [Leptospirales bacterium]|nr:membrane protein insertion efficiency factor YidD [Leptospirales bacterium]